jgi:hypothetical protein
MSSSLYNLLLLKHFSNTIFLFFYFELTLYDPGLIQNILLSYGVHIPLRQLVCNNNWVFLFSKNHNVPCFVSLAYQDKDIVFRFSVESSSLMDFDP